MKLILLSFIVATVTLTGCSYNVPTKVAPAANIYNSYGDIIPGKYYLTVRSGDFSREIKPSSYLCSFHSYPIDANAV